MGQLQFKKLTTEKQELIHFLCANTWPFHAENKQNMDGTVSDCVLYSAIYTDWASNGVTLVKPDEVPY